MAYAIWPSWLRLVSRVPQLAARCGQHAAQPLARFGADQCHALLAAYLPDLGASLLDQSLDMLDKILGELVRKGNKKQERHFQSNVQNRARQHWQCPAAVQASLMFEHTTSRSRLLNGYI